jgi:transposase
VVVCLDETGPLPPRSRPGHEVVKAVPGIKPDGSPRPAGRAKHPIKAGSRARGGYVFGALRPVTGQAFTRPYDHRRGKDWVDFLEHVEEWIPPEVEPVYAVLDNLPTHKTTDVLLFALWHPRWEFVFQPKYAPYLNLIEPWWKVLKSLAIEGREFETWQQVCKAVRRSTAYWNKHRHAFVWGRRRRHHAQRRGPGVARVPGVRRLAG